MCSGYRLALILALASTALAADLRVCADPDNLPYSNLQQKGFENDVAALVGRQLGRPIRYVWISQRGKYFQALAAGVCDAVMEAPTGFPQVLTTHPYYRSIYVFLTRRDRHLGIRSFNDPRLKSLRIGVQVIGADDAAAPPAEALSARGMIANVTWYRLYQNYLSANQPAVLIEAVAHGDVDVGIAWGPLAGYFARTAPRPLDITPVSPRFERSVPFAFDISMAVRRGDSRLAAQLNTAIERNAVAIRHILDRYGVPCLASDAAAGPPHR